MTAASADLLWVLISTILVWIIIPGSGFVYSGMTNRKNALSFLWLSLMSVSVTSLQWFLIGYSLSFSPSGSPFIGDFANVALTNILSSSTSYNTTVPTIAFCLFQMMFAASTATIVTGSISERGRMWPAIVFIFLWCTFVYNFTSYWVWSSNGWARGLGIIDHAGGIPIHITAGASSLAYSFVLGRRHTVGNNFGQKPHNINNIFVGTVLMWFGWFGFNGGSGLVISVRTVIICIVTNLSACAGGLTWCILDYFLSKPKHKFSLFGFCMGSIAGLVCVTPGSGYITIPFSIVFGVTGSTCVYFGRKIKNLFRIDDPFDIFAQHGIGGSVGSILTGIFAEKSIPAIDSLSICGGWLDGCWMQVIYQLIGVFAGLIWSFSVTAIILLIMNRIPSLSLRTTIDGEMKGIDADQFGEYAYDYIEFQRSNATLQFNTLSAHELLIKTEVENVRSTKKQKIQPITKIEPLTVKSVA